MFCKADDAGGLTPGKEDNDAGHKLYCKALSDFDWRVVLLFKAHIIINSGKRKDGFIIP